MQNTTTLFTPSELRALNKEFSFLSPVTDMSTKPWSSELGVSLRAIARHYAPKGAL